MRLGWPKAAPTSLTGSYLRCGRHIRQARSRGPQGVTGLPRNPNSLAWLAYKFAAFQLDRRLHAHWLQSCKQPVSKFIAGHCTCRLCCACMLESVLSILDKSCRLYSVLRHITMELCLQDFQIDLDNGSELAHPQQIKAQDGSA